MGEPIPLSACIEGSFPYNTVKDRLPIILTKVIDLLCREKQKIATEYGKVALEEIKVVIARLSKLKNEMQTNKPLRLIDDHDDVPEEDFIEYSDTVIWNVEHERYTDKNNEAPRWFVAPWLYVECYMYKMIHHAFSGCIRDYDPFFCQKHDALKLSMSAVQCVLSHTFSLIRSSDDVRPCKDTFRQLLEISVWGNQCDLSISAGDDNHRTNNIINALEELRSNLLVNDYSSVWQLLNDNKHNHNGHIVMVLDNAGFELITDLCLLTYMMESGLIKTVAIHVKTRPWFVSDTTKQDFHFTLEELRKEKGVTESMALKWSSYLADNRWTLVQNKFWTTSHDFSQMNKMDPDLYSEISTAKLVIFKGDLNYRKLVGDLDWPKSSNFNTALRGFAPTIILALRTVKGGPVVGLQAEESEKLYSTVTDWDYSGNYGMIQLSSML